MNNVTIHPYLCQHLYSFGGIQGTRSLIDWIILACRESWPKERHLPGHVQHCKYVENNKVLGSGELEKQSTTLSLQE